MPMETPDPSQVVVRCADRWGRSTIARFGRWRSHIEVKHAEVDRHFAAVEATVAEADLVTFDATYPDRENFYKLGALPGLEHLYMKVCVGYGPVDATGTIIGGTVITVYPTHGMGRGEVQKWP
jgi:hypothetical protein